MAFLHESYNRTSFVNFLSDKFLPEDFQACTTEVVITYRNNYASKIFKLGKCGSLDLEVFEVHHKATKDARVGIAKDAFQLLLHQSYCNRALIAFVPTTGNQWRFSLLQIEAEINDKTNRIHRGYSNPRRFSFLLGEGALIKTPTQFLIEKGRVRQRTEGNKNLSPWEDLQHRFSIEVLTKEFYGKLYNWYLWSIDKRTGVTFPNNPNTEADDRDKLEIKMIRLITRMLFVWFIKQKKLVPDNLFDTSFLTNVLRNFTPDAIDNGDYYNAILQNLFFATLNQEKDQREFVRSSYHGRSESFGVKTLFRDNKKKSWFTFPENEKELRVKALFDKVPYLNGGLFECLDKFDLDENEKLIPITYFDGFSTKDSRLHGNLQYRAFIPNRLFFAPEHTETVTVKEATATTAEETQTITVMGLIELFRLYNFTVEENTTSDKEVSLDPELLGRVFENLLAAYNPETQESARKSTGSFYTPREIVDYMVDESLITYLSGKCGHDADTMRNLVKDEGSPRVENRQKVIEDLKSIKILDPACGSGAFPMGILLKITDIIERLTPQEEFDRYQTKLDIIKNCVYGIDIQAIAMLICKLRFFISLICDCEKDETKPNLGIIPLPNLETKFVAANSLLPAKVREFDNDWSVDNHLKQLQKELLDLRLSIFDLRRHKEKVNNKIADRNKCREIEAYIKKTIGTPDLEKIKRLQQTIHKLESELPKYQTDLWTEETIIEHSLFGDSQTTVIRRNVNKEKQDEILTRIRNAKNEINKEEKKSSLPGFSQAVDQVTHWDPYDQNSVSPFFDAEWMFGIGFNSPSKQGGFDLVIGNPPYISHDSISEDIPCREFTCFEPYADLFCYFFEMGIKALSAEGILNYITSNSFLRSNYGHPLRKYINHECTILKVIDIEGTQVFDSAIVNTAITLLKKGKSNEDALIVNVEWQRGTFDNYVSTNGFVYHQQDFDLQPWTLIRPIYLNLRKKIEKSGTSLMGYNTKIRLGLATGDNNAFLLNENKKRLLLSLDPKNADIIKPVIRGQDIQRYFHTAPQYLLLTKNGVDVQKDYPTVYSYLDSFGEKFKRRGAKGRHWTNLRACAFFDDFKKEKIIWIELTDKGRFSLSDKEEYLLNSAYFLIPPSGISTKYLLGILNSKVVRFYIKLVAATSGMGTLRWINNFVKLIPIPVPTEMQLFTIKKLVDIILEKKAVNVDADTTNEEKKIDSLVYTLYGLTDEETKMIEQAD